MDRRAQHVRRQLRDLQREHDWHPAELHRQVARRLTNSGLVLPATTLDQFMRGRPSTGRTLGKIEFALQHWDGPPPRRR